MARTLNEKTRDETVVNVLSRILETLERIVTILESKNAGK
jgi:hypothetical protein